MINSEQIKVFDGDYEIIYSADFNVYENKLILGKILNFNFEFQFYKDSTKKGTFPLEIKGDNAIKKITIKLTNFNNPLGIGTTKKIPVINVDESDRKIYLSVHVKSLSESTDFLKVSLTFYLK